MRCTAVGDSEDGSNWYSYCGNDPVNYVDVLGLCSEGGSSLYQTAGSLALTGAYTSQLDGPLPGPADVAAAVIEATAGVVLAAAVVDDITGGQVTELLENIGNALFSEADDEESPDNEITKPDRLQPTGDSESTTRLVDENGNPITDRHYGEDGNAEYNIDYTDHGNSATHPEVPHRHDWDWSSGRPVRGPGYGF